mgnify:CR=1 FL=1
MQNPMQVPTVTNSSLPNASPKVVVSDSTHHEAAAKAQDKMAGQEMCTIVGGWALMLGVWFHLFVLMGCAGPSVRPNSGMCQNYYGAAFWVIFVINLIAYYVEAHKSPVRQYLSNSMSLSPIRAYLGGLHLQQPILWWQVQCYHMETRVVTQTHTRADGSSYTTTSTQQVRVDTHFARGAFAYTFCEDTSETIIIPSRVNVIRLRLTKSYEFADSATRSAYDAEFAEFVRLNDRDVHKDVRSGMDLEGFEELVMTVQDDQQAPVLLKLPFFYLFTVLLVGMPYRHWFFWVTTAMDYAFVKKVSRGQVPPPAGAVLPFGLPVLPPLGGGLLVPMGVMMPPATTVSLPESSAQPAGHGGPTTKV